jgi:hypothetical protein
MQGFKRHMNDSFCTPTFFIWKKTNILNLMNLSGSFFFTFCDFSFGKVVELRAILKDFYLKKKLMWNF